MKFAIQNPMLTVGYDDIGIHDYVIEFIREFKPIIYLSDKTLFWQWLQYLYKNNLSIWDYTVVYSPDKLNYLADVLFSFTGAPYKKINEMPKGFTGLKMMHIMDYMCRPEESNRALLRMGVDYLFGYAQHDIHCNFFKMYYPQYLGKVLAVPFGFNKRFVSSTPFSDRLDRVAALGSVSLFCGRLKGESYLEAINYFLFEKKELFMHKFRRMLVLEENDLAPIMDSRLPHYPREADFCYDLVAEFNKYKLFTCCESLFYFPAAKTFEGPAAGSVLVCSDHPCFDDLGFVHGVNCVKHKQFDVDNFKRVISEYINQPVKLETIQKTGTEFVRTNYNHKKIAYMINGMVSVIK